MCLIVLTSERLIVHLQIVKKNVIENFIPIVIAAKHLVSVSECVGECECVCVGECECVCLWVGG